MDKKGHLFQDKRAQGLSTNAIILIILGVVVLVVLAIGFMIGWDKLVPYVSQNNVNTIVSSCANVCDQGSSYDYCNYERELKDADKNKIKTTCNLFSNIGEYAQKYGIQKCSSLCEKKPCGSFKVTIDGKEHIGTDATSGLYNITNLADSSSIIINSQCWIV